MHASTRIPDLAAWMATCAGGLAATAALTLSPERSAPAQRTSRTVVAVLAHGDDEVPVGPILARYAREGVQVYLVIATDGAQGGANTSIPRGAELARVRADEARCAAQALGVNPPILLGFPDGQLGDYAADRTLLYRLTERMAAEFERLRPDAVITWGPDGGTGHPDHRLVSDIVTQLVRAGAPGAPERLLYMNLPAEAFRTINVQRGAPPLLIPQPKYFSVRVSFAPEDLDAAQRALACHRSQFTPEILQQIVQGQRRVLNGVIPLAPAFSAEVGTELFR
jgi:LmbE family N-acetylglucosaminyl deacetylase